MPTKGNDANRPGLSGPVACCLLLLVCLVVVATYLISTPEPTSLETIQTASSIDPALEFRTLAARLGVTALLLTVTGTSIALARAFVVRERRVVTTISEARPGTGQPTRPLRFLACLSAVVLVAVASLIAAVTTLFGL